MAKDITAVGLSSLLCRLRGALRNSLETQRDDKAGYFVLSLRIGVIKAQGSLPFVPRSLNPLIVASGSR